MKNLKIKIFNQLWPMNMQDYSKGNTPQKVKAYESNRKNVDSLIIPILNWILILLSSYTILYLGELFLKNNIFSCFLIALAGIIFSVAVVFALILSYAFIFLKNVELKYQSDI